MQNKKAANKSSSISRAQAFVFPAPAPFRSTNTHHSLRFGYDVSQILKLVLGDDEKVGDCTLRGRRITQGKHPRLNFYDRCHSSFMVISTNVRCFSSWRSKHNYRRAECSRAEKLATAIREVITEKDMRQRAEKLGKQIETISG